MSGGHKPDGEKPSPKAGGTTRQGEMARLLWEVSQMASQGFSPEEIAIAWQEKIQQLDKIAQQEGWGRVFSEPFPHPVAGEWLVFQGQPILPEKHRPVLAIHRLTGQVLVGTTRNIRVLPSGEMGLFNFQSPKKPE